ncbi:hypothetical protein IWW50_004149, partial [Coemansia erecta]
QLHLLPCSIDHDGPVKSSTYFIPQPQTKDSTFETAFRGRQLHGRSIELPEGYSGHVVVECVSENTNDIAFEENDGCAQLELRSTEQFDRFTVWEHDRLPMPDDDEVISALAWIQVANSIHSDDNSNL